MKRKRHTYRSPIVVRKPNVNRTIEALSAVEELLNRLADGVGFAVEFEDKKLVKRVQQARVTLDDAAILLLAVAREKAAK